MTPGIRSVLTAGACLASLVIVSAAPASAANHRLARVATCGHQQVTALFADTESEFLYRIDVASGKTTWQSRLPEAPEQPDSVSVPTCGSEGYVVTGSGYQQ